VRRRLLVSTLLVAVVSVILLGIPLGVVATRLIRDESQKRLNREAAQVAADLDTTRADGVPLSSSSLAAVAADDRYTVVSVPGSTVTAGARINGPVLKASVTGGFGDVVAVYASDRETTRQIAIVWAVVGGLAIVALGAAVGLARLQAKRLVGPLEDLVETAQRLGSGDPAPRNRHFGVPEIDKVAQVLDRSAERIDRLLRAERELAANASHQLRTPLTALSIRLEEIIGTALHPRVRDEATAALAATERLTAVVDSLLAEHGTFGHAASSTIVDVDEILTQQQVEWEPVFRRNGRALTVTGRRGLKASAGPAVLAQVVATLIDNALTHGAGAVSLRTRQSGGHVVLDVTDEGAGVPDGVASRIFERSFSGSSSTGLGLSLARDLVEATGGRLELTSARPPVFSVFLKPDVG
jgi:signal transduction histidine kinase